MIKRIGGDQRSGQIDWDFPDLKRNYGEPMHIDFYMDMETRLNTEDRGYSLAQFTSFFLIIMAFFLGLIYISPTCSSPFSKKQLPAEGPHYTFEKVE